MSALEWSFEDVQMKLDEYNENAGKSISLSKEQLQIIFDRVGNSGSLYRIINEAIEDEVESYIKENKL